MACQNILCLFLLLVNGHVWAKNLGETCTTNQVTDECSVDNSECKTATCACKNGFKEEDGKCLKGVGENCATVDECVSNAVCATTCGCKSGYNPVSGLCKKAPVSDVVCTDGGGECNDIAHSTCDTTVDVLKCKCKAGYKVDAIDDSVCVKAPVPDVVCTDGGDECNDIAHSECDTTVGVLKCKCKAGYKVDATDDSVCVKVIGSQCSGSNACSGVPNSVCVSDKCVCASDYGEKNNLCILTVGGTDCTDTGVECESIDNAICDAKGGKCKCSPGFAMNIDTCVPENGAATTRHNDATILAISVLVAIKVVFW